MIRSILFRCDGSHKIGFGHVIRCLALADELRENHGCNIIFAVLLDQKAIEMIENHGYPVETADRTRKDFSYGEWLNSVVANINARGIILDVRDDLPSETIKNLRGKGILIATIDDPTDRRLLADLAFYPPVPQVERMEWRGFTGQLFVGWEWVVLRREFSQKYRKFGIKINDSISSIIPNILVTMGGSDPRGMTLKAIEALNFLDKHFETTIVLGPGFTRRKELKDLIHSFNHPYKIYENTSNMAELMAGANLAVASFGVTAYELASMGVPAIHLCLTEDHAESASIFHEEMVAFCLGQIDEVTNDMLVKEIKRILTDNALRTNMSKRMQKLISGNGAYLITQKIITEISSERNERMGVT